MLEGVCKLIQLPRGHGEGLSGFPPLRHRAFDLPEHFARLGVRNPQQSPYSSQPHGFIAPSDPSWREPLGHSLGIEQEPRIVPPNVRDLRERIR